MATKCGGTGELQQPDDRVNEVAQKVKAELEAKTGKTYSTFKPVGYKTQVVAGTNYFIKVLTDEAAGDHVHLRVYNHFSGSTELSDFQEGKKADDALEYF